MTSMGKTEKCKTDDDVLNTYRYMKSEQRFMMSKLAELELDVHEHKLVIDALKGVDKSRKCFRMVNGILCELFVKDVYPLIETSKVQLLEACEDLSKQIDEKEREITDYKRKFKLAPQGDDLLEEELETELKKQSGSVLVAN